jgi:hopanoid biosynthesis associated protein HpnK
MGSADGLRRLIVNADDFGNSPSINRAVIDAHRTGILTTASLMVNGEAFLEAVALARQNPRLGVGLHLTLVCGRATLSPKEIPGLVDPSGTFSNNAVNTGFRLFFQRSLVAQLQQEIAAQFEKFQTTGLVLDHVNGHLNLHLHPTVLGLLVQHAKAWGVQRLRLTRDLFGLDLHLGRGRWGYRLSHAAVFGLLSRWAQPKLQEHQIRHTSAVFGLLQTGRVTESYLLELLPQLPMGDSELYSHPSLKESKHEFDALVSPRVRQLAEANRIKFIRYQDL